MVLTGMLSRRVEILVAALCLALITGPQFAAARPPVSGAQILSELYQQLGEATTDSTHNTPTIIYPDDDINRTVDILHGSNWDINARMDVELPPVGFSWCHYRKSETREIDTQYCEQGHSLSFLGDPEGFDHDILYDNEDATELELFLFFRHLDSEGWEDYDASGFQMSSNNQELIRNQDIMIMDHGPGPIYSENGAPEFANLSILVSFTDTIGDVALTLTSTRKDGRSGPGFTMNLRVVGLQYTNISPSGSLQEANMGIVFDSYLDTSAKKQTDIFVQFKFSPPRQLLSDRDQPSARAVKIIIPGLDVDDSTEPPEHPYDLQFLWSSECKATLSDVTECGFAFLPDEDTIQIRFEQYRTATGKLPLTLMYTGFILNGYSKTYMQPFSIEWLDLAPPVVDNVESPAVLDHNGGEKVTITGFNLFESQNSTQLFVTASGSNGAFLLPEDIDSRRTIQYRRSVDFITGPGLGNVDLTITSATNESDADKSAVLRGGHVTQLRFDDLEEPEDGESRAIIVFGFPAVSLISVLERSENSSNLLRCMIAEGVSIDCDKTDLLQANGSGFDFKGERFSGTSTNVSFRVKANTENSVFGSIRDFLDSNKLNQEVYIIETQFEGATQDTAEASATLIIALTVTAALTLAVAGVAIQVVTLMLPAVRGPASSSFVVAQPSIVLQPVPPVPSVPRADETLEEMALREEAEAMEAELRAIASDTSTFSYRAPTGNTNPYMAIRVAQRTAAYGQINAPGIASPFVDVASAVSVFNLQRPAFEGTTEAPRLSQGTRLPVTVRDLNNFYDAYQEDLLSLFRGQVFTILLISVILLSVHILLYFVLYKWKKTHNLAMDIIPKVEVFFLNFIYLGVFLGSFQVLTTRESEETEEERPFWFYIAAASLLIIVGLGYPAFVFFLVFQKIKPNLDPQWLSAYFLRHIYNGGWRDGLSEHHKGNDYFGGKAAKSQGGSFLRGLGNNPPWYKPINTWRFAGAWVHTHRIRRRYGDLFDAYKGQYYFYFFIELIILGLEGIIIGALSSFPEAQAGLLLTIQLISLFLILWLLPFNDMIERVLQIFVSTINVAVGILAVIATRIEPESDQSIRLSIIMLFLNLGAICVTVLYCFFAFAEILWLNRQDVKNVLQRCFVTTGDSRAFSIGSSLGESEISMLQEELQGGGDDEEPRMIDTAVLYGGHDMYMSDGESGDEEFASEKQTDVSLPHAGSSGVQSHISSLDNFQRNSGSVQLPAELPAHWQNARPERMPGLTRRINAGRISSEDSFYESQEGPGTSSMNDIVEGSDRHEASEQNVRPPPARRGLYRSWFRRKALDHTD